MAIKREINKNFWQHMLPYYSMSHPNHAQLVRIIFAFSRENDPVEKLCYKDRNKLTFDYMQMEYLIDFLKNISQSNYESAAGLIYTYFIH